ncbi:hypothetical protein GCM10027259_13570 [Micromonospora palomenae]
MTPLSRRPSPAASHLFYERLAPDPTPCQKNFSRDRRRSGPAGVMSALCAEIIAAAAGYE